MNGREIPALVLGMPPAEWTVALYASDMPNLDGEHSAEQIAAWIAQGAEQLGEVEVWWRHRETLRLVEDTSDAGNAAWRRLWPKPRRYERAGDVAYRLRCMLRDAGVRLPVQRKVSVPVVIVDDDLGDSYSVEVYARDLEMAERRAAEQALAGAA